MDVISYFLILTKEDMTITLMYLFVEDVNSWARGTYEFHKKISHQEIK